MNFKEAMQICLQDKYIRRKKWDYWGFLCFNNEGCLCDESRGSSGVSAEDSEAEDWIEVDISGRPVKTKETSREWFKKNKDELSPEVLRNCETWMSVVYHHGLENETYSFTRKHYTDREGLDNSHDEKFMRALSEAMHEWDM